MRIGRGLLLPHSRHEAPLSLLLPFPHILHILPPCSRKLALYMCARSDSVAQAHICILNKTAAEESHVHANMRKLTCMHVHAASHMHACACDISYTCIRHLCMHVAAHTHACGVILAASRMQSARASMHAHEMYIHVLGTRLNRSMQVHEIAGLCCQYWRQLLDLRTCVAHGPEHGGVLPVGAGSYSDNKECEVEARVALNETGSRIQQTLGASVQE